MHRQVHSQKYKCYNKECVINKYVIYYPHSEILKTCSECKGILVEYTKTNEGDNNERHDEERTT